MPETEKTCSKRGFGANAVKFFSKVLRGAAKATLKNPLKAAKSTFGVLFLTSLTTAEVTLGAGSKQLAGTSQTISHSP